jgi:coiled-coil and C2 domain-containing protein 1
VTAFSLLLCFENCLSSASTASRAESQALFLQERQLQFKKAALIAKKNGDLALAKNYLRLAKGFDQMIQAAQSGLPVDLSQVCCLKSGENANILKHIFFFPRFPLLQDLPLWVNWSSFLQMKMEKCWESVMRHIRSWSKTSFSKSGYVKCTKCLSPICMFLLQTCTTNADHFTKLGDVTSASRFVLRSFIIVHMPIYNFFAGLTKWGRIRAKI